MVRHQQKQMWVPPRVVLLKTNGIQPLRGKNRIGERRGIRIVHTNTDGEDRAGVHPGRRLVILLAGHRAWHDVIRPFPRWPDGSDGGFPLGLKRPWCDLPAVVLGRRREPPAHLSALPSAHHHHAIGAPKSKTLFDGHRFLQGLRLVAHQAHITLGIRLIEIQIRRNLTPFQSQ